MGSHKVGLKLGQLGFAKILGSVSQLEVGVKLGLWKMAFQKAALNLGQLGPFTITALIDWVQVRLCWVKKIQSVTLKLG